MYCKNCGQQIEDGAKFCDKCGAPQDNKGDTQVQPIEFQNQFEQQTKPKKPIHKKWWFWVIIAVVAIGVIGAATGNNGNNAAKTDSKQAVTNVVEETTKEEITAEPTTEKPTEPPTEKPTEDPTKLENEFKDSCDTIDFKTLSRNPDKYKGNNYKFTGEVIQVQESSWGDTVDLRINITKEEFEYIDDVMWTDTIYATVEIPDGEDKILEDDILTFWGTCEGNYTYTSVLGSSVSLPKISIKYFELSE
ncbi:MAG: zinc-ribbon domain-containing protein [Ruminococcus sp.]|nr:zinc-ribbon domain-containing protein [Ruminococcus sp.]